MLSNEKSFIDRRSNKLLMDNINSDVNVAWLAHMIMLLWGANLIYCNKHSATLNLHIHVWCTYTRPFGSWVRVKPIDFCKDNCIASVSSEYALRIPFWTPYDSIFARKEISLVLVAIKLHLWWMVVCATHILLSPHIDTIRRRIHKPISSPKQKCSSSNAEVRRRSTL